METMSTEKISLGSFRTFLFFFFAGAGCFIPFLSLHLKSSGLSTEDIRFISYVAPLFAALGPIFTGPLVDYFTEKRKNVVGKSSTRSDRSAPIRTILATVSLLSALFYCLLLSAPKIENLNAKQPEATFVCNEHGASFVQEKCSDSNCFQYLKTKTGTATLQNCKFNCNFPSHYGYLDKYHGDADRGAAGRAPATPPGGFTTKRTTVLPRPQSLRPEIDISNLDDFFGTEPNDDYDDGDSGSGEESEFNWNKNTRGKRDAQSDQGFSLEESPHICHERITKGKSSRTCFVFTPNSAAFNVTVRVKPYQEDEYHCSYPLRGNFSCRIPRHLDRSTCKVFCELENIYSAEDVLLNSKCRHILNDETLTFWTYFTFRSMGDLFFSAAVSIVIGAAVVAAGEDIGREFVLPSLSYGFFAVLVGYLHSDDLSPLQLENIPDYFLGIVGYGFFMIFALMVLIFAPNWYAGPPDWWKSSKNLHVRHKAEFYAVLLVLILLGMLWGPIYFHVPWHITETGGVALYVGCAAAAGALASLLFVWKAYKIIDYCGYSNILIAAFTIYILRYTGLLFIDNPWILSAVGAMEAITLCLMLFSAIFYIRHLVPRHLTFTSQALAIAAHFCLGGGLGCLVSTLLSPDDAEIERAQMNATKIEIDLENGKIENEFRAPYHLIYCVGAISSAVAGVIYFLLYHCCLKKKCFAPLYRSDHNGSLPQDSGEKGVYTPLRIIRNGTQNKDESET